MHYRPLISSWDLGRVCSLSTVIFVPFFSCPPGGCLFFEMPRIGNLRIIDPSEHTCIPLPMRLTIVDCNNFVAHGVSHVYHPCKNYFQINSQTIFSGHVIPYLTGTKFSIICFSGHVICFTGLLPGFHPENNLT